MSPLTDAGRALAAAIAARHGLSEMASVELVRAYAAGGGGQAQFSHAELGGMGQWMAGGMMMIGDMFNAPLKARVAAALADIAREPAAGLARAPHDFAEWPEGLGAAAASGGQNDMAYAVFPATRRLAIREGGRLRIFDTGDHAIAGVWQQSGAGLRFASQHGPVDLAALTEVTETSARQPEAAPPPPDADDALARLERLAALHRAGALTDEEFAAKKADLLKRI
ncbi:MAG: SHOCT domain-containing protein [Rhizobiales bacterium]|nr:SHOCT domain-containing protein [Hyphomicrobiales bacterium]